MVVIAVVAGSSLICRICVAQPAASSPSGAVVLEAKDEASVNVTAARATIDGAQVVDRLDGVPIEVSPGTHHVVFEAAGFRRSESTFVVTEGQRLRVVVFLIATPAEIIMSLPAHPDEPEPARPTSNRQRTVGLAVAGAGLAGIAVGSIWSLMSRSTYDDALSNECGGNPGGCSAQGIADGKTAHSQAMVATIGFVAGGVLLAAGAALYFTGPKRNGAGLAVAPALDGAGHAGMMLAGAW
jgi:hypothetical protein